MFAALNSFLTRAVSGYFLNKSLRFRSSASAYLNRTFAAGNQSTWTWSAWVKRGVLGTYPQMFSAGAGTGGSPELTIVFEADALRIDSYNGSTTVFDVKTTALYRDPAAWYHVVVAFDTTQATAADRVKFYINGQQITSLATASYPGQNTTHQINAATSHQISGSTRVAAYYYDGEMAEVNFVDGQALAPTAFGASSTYNQWLPIKYAGTYGTNGFYLPFSGGTATSYAGSFNGSSQYLSVAKNALFEPATSGAWTIECFFFTTSTALQEIWTYGNSTISAGSDLGTYINVTGSGIVLGGFYSGGSGITVTGGATALNTWHHLALVSTGTTMTLYFNGNSLGSVSVSGTSINAPSSATGRIGQYNSAGAQYFNGYISNFRFVKGTAVYTANFIPPTAALTAVTNTSLLTLQSATVVDNSGNSLAITNNGTVVTSVQSPFLNTTVLTADSSGNANNWTPNNISLTAGSTYDSLTDVPTLTSTTVANYPVLSPLSTYNGGGTLSNGNLTVSLVDTANNKPTIVADTGKWYAEFTCVSAGGYSGTGLAIVTSGASTLYPITLLRTDYCNNGQTYSYNASAYVSYGASWTSGDVIGVAWDCSAAQVTFYKNGVSQGAISSPTLSLTASGTPFSFIPNSYNTTVTSSFSVNYGQQPWKYSIPSGFLPLNTFNI